MQLNTHRLLSLRNQGQHESVSLLSWCLSFLPTDIFELLLSLATFWLVRVGCFLCRRASMILSGIRPVQYRAVLLSVLFQYRACSFGGQ